MTTQTWIEIGAAGGSWIKDWAPVIGPSISALATLITGWFVVWYARRQAFIAKDKLSLDLFDRRLAAWESMSAAINAAFEQCHAVWTAGPNGAYAHEGLDKSMTKAAWKQARWLFGRDVLVKFALLESNFSEFRARLFVDWNQDASMGKRTTRYQIGEHRLMTAYTELQEAVEPYMMLDKIAVNRPARRWQMPWPFRRRDRSV